MFGRIVLTALAAGVIAGVFVWGAHMVKTTPLILQAEVYEGAAPDHSHGAAPAAAAEDESWAPADGIERGAYSFLADMLSSIGFAFMLTGAMALAGRGDMVICLGAGSITRWAADLPGAMQALLDQRGAA